MALKERNFWPVAVVVLLIILGVFIWLYFKPSGDTSLRDQIKTLKAENTALKQSMTHYNDSLNAVVKIKDSTNTILGRELVSITNKYIALRRSHPIHDTVVKTEVVYQGSECLEKLPIVEMQLKNCLSEVVDLKLQANGIWDGSQKIQKQFDECMALNADQQKQLKKIDRKRKWNKVWAVTSSAAAVGILTLFVIK